MCIFTVAWVLHVFHFSFRVKDESIVPLFELIDHFFDPFDLLFMIF